MKKLLLLSACLWVGFVEARYASAADAEIEWLLATIEGASDFTNANDTDEISRKLGRFGCSESEDTKASEPVIEVKCDESRVMSRVNFLRINKLLGKIPDDFASTHPVLITGQLLFTFTVASIESYLKENKEIPAVTVVGTYAGSDDSYKRYTETVFKISVKRDDFAKTTSTNNDLLSVLSGLPGFQLSEWYESRLSHEMH